MHDGSVRLKHMLEAVLLIERLEEILTEEDTA